MTKGDSSSIGGNCDRLTILAGSSSKRGSKFLFPFFSFLLLFIFFFFLKSLPAFKTPPRLLSLSIYLFFSFFLVSFFFLSYSPFILGCISGRPQVYSPSPIPPPHPQPSSSSPPWPLPPNWPPLPLSSNTRCWIRSPRLFDQFLNAAWNCRRKDPAECPEITVTVFEFQRPMIVIARYREPYVTLTHRETQTFYYLDGMQINF